MGLCLLLCDSSRDEERHTAHGASGIYSPAPHSKSVVPTLCPWHSWWGLWTSGIDTTHRTLVGNTGYTPDLSHQNLHFSLYPEALLPIQGGSAGGTATWFAQD